MIVVAPFGNDQPLCTATLSPPLAWIWDHVLAAERPVIVLPSPASHRRRRLALAAL
jgi:hypothetical protein